MWNFAWVYVAAPLSVQFTFEYKYYFLFAITNLFSQSKRLFFDNIIVHVASMVKIGQFTWNPNVQFSSFTQFLQVMQNGYMTDAKLLRQFACCQVWSSFNTDAQMLILNAWESTTFRLILEIELATLDLLEPIVGRAMTNCVFAECLVDMTLRLVIV